MFRRKRSFSHHQVSYEALFFIINTQNPIRMADDFGSRSLSMHPRRNPRRALPPTPSSHPNPHRAVSPRQPLLQLYEAIRPHLYPLKMSRQRERFSDGPRSPRPVHQLFARVVGMGFAGLLAQPR